VIQLEKGIKSNAVHKKELKETSRILLNVVSSNSSAHHSTTHAQPKPKPPVMCQVPVIL